MTQRSLTGIITAITAFLFFSAGLIYLYKNHPFEDAYIIFNYVERFTAGKGIVYYNGGPRAEGFVDFLWFLLLSALRLCRFDVSLSALLLNTAGTALCSYCFSSLIFGSKARPLTKIFLAGFAFLPCFYSGAWAGFLAFSTPLYSAIALILYIRFIRSSSPGYSTALLAFTLGFFRAEGFLTGFCFVILDYGLAIKDGHKKNAGPVLLFAVLTAAFMFWRMTYFGRLFPLPFYIKNTGTGLSGWHSNLSWLRGEGGFVEGYSGGLGPSPWLLILFSLVFFALHRYKIKGLHRPALGLIPFLVYFIYLGSLAQHQNLFYRYQSPILIVLYAFIIVLITHEDKNTPERFKPWAAGLLSLWVSVSFVYSFWSAATFYAYKHRSPHYFYGFAQRLGRLLPPSSVMAVTEAGAFAYWAQCRIEDTVGLNNPDLSKQAVTLDYLENLSPDFVMFHVRQTITLPQAQRVSAISPDELIRGVRPAYAEILRQPSANHRNSFYAADAAPVIMAVFLQQEAERYDILAVEGQHIIGIKKNHPKAGEIAQALHQSLEESPSYAQAKNFFLSK